MYAASASSVAPSSRQPASCFRPPCSSPQDSSSAIPSFHLQNPSCLSHHHRAAPRPTPTPTRPRQATPSTARASPKGATTSLSTWSRPRTVEVGEGRPTSCRCSWSSSRSAAPSSPLPLFAHDSDADAKFDSSRALRTSTSRLGPRPSRPSSRPSPSSGPSSRNSPRWWQSNARPSSGSMQTQPTSQSEGLTSLPGSLRPRLTEAPSTAFQPLPSNVSGAQRELLKYYASVSSNRMLMVKIFGVLIIFVRAPRSPPSPLTRSRLTADSLLAQFLLFILVT